MISKTILIGRLGMDAETKYLESGVACSNFTIATNEMWKDKTTGEKKQKTEWHKIVAYGRLAEICGEFLKKGSLVYVEGKNVTRSYEKANTKHYITEVVISEMQMLKSMNEKIDNS